jgi:hypothetical protein
MSDADRLVAMLCEISDLTELDAAVAAELEARQVGPATGRGMSLAGAGPGVRAAGGGGSAALGSDGRGKARKHGCGKLAAEVQPTQRADSLPNLRKHGHVCGKGVLTKQCVSRADRFRLCVDPSFGYHWGSPYLCAACVLVRLAVASNSALLGKPRPRGHARRRVPLPRTRCYAMRSICSCLQRTSRCKETTDERYASRPSRL